MKHFKLTNETKVVLGRTLYRIELTVDCKWGEKGTKGGWVEKESNLSGNAWVSGNAEVHGDARVFGNAWVSGDARVSGNARVSGDAWVSGDARVSPIFISSLRYPITITDKHIRIGCKFHSFEDWEEFDDKRILEMEGKQSLKWWKVHKPLIMGIVEANRNFKRKE